LEQNPTGWLVLTHRQSCQTMFAHYQ
jgi:hypothetical protein